MADTDFRNIADQEIVKLLNSVALQEGFRDYTVKRINNSVKGDGYLGSITTIQIENTADVNEKKVLSLILKTASKSDALRKEAPIESIYDREIYMYNIVFPTFRLLEKQSGLPQSIFTAKLYKAESANKNESLIFENLKECGFKLYNCKIPMDDDHVSLVLTTYGRFHALSFALKDQDPKKFQKITEPLDDIFTLFIRKANFIPSCIDHCKKGEKMLDPTFHKEALNTYKAFIDEIPQFLENLPTAVDNYSVALHGDGWTNNMLFKYKDNDGVEKLSDMRLLDFQLSRLGPPVLDLTYFFYSCGSKEMLNKLDYYLKLYYDSLATHLTKLGSNPDKMYPYSVLKQQWKKYARFGLIMSVLIIHVMLTEKDETVDLADVADSGEHIRDAFNYELSNSDAFNDRIRHIILHFVENNFI